MKCQYRFNINGARAGIRRSATCIVTQMTLTVLNGRPASGIWQPINLSALGIEKFSVNMLICAGEVSPKARESRSFLVRRGKDIFRSRRSEAKCGFDSSRPSALGPCFSSFRLLGRFFFRINLVISSWSISVQSSLGHSYFYPCVNFLVSDFNACTLHSPLKAPFLCRGLQVLGFTSP
jgi:hypothetical protein